MHFTSTMKVKREAFTPIAIPTGDFLPKTSLMPYIAFAIKIFYLIQQIPFSNDNGHFFS